MICCPSTQSAAIAPIVVAMRGGMSRLTPATGMMSRSPRTARCTAARHEQRRDRDDVEGDVNERLRMQGRPAHA
jgi:hypothetical protein